MRPGRDDAGMALSELIVAMVVSAFLFGMVLTTMTTSLRLVRSAPPDTNPNVFGALAAAAARLEARIVPDLECANPINETTRGACTDITSQPATARSHDGHTGCWVVATDAGRRLECWELLQRGDDQGDVVAHRYAPTADDPAALLNIRGPGAWEPEPDQTRPVAGGVAHLARSAPLWAREACAAIRAEQRQLLTDESVPFCDGTRGVLDATGAARTVDVAGVPTACTELAAAAEAACTEGHPMPPVRIRP